METPRHDAARGSDKPVNGSNGTAGFGAVDRTRVTIGSMHDPDPDLNYWLSKSPAERIAAIEQCREAFYGRDAVRGRLARVLEVARMR